MIVEILLVVTLFLWFLAMLPVAPVVANYPWATNWLAWISVVLLAVFLFMPGIR